MSRIRLFPYLILVSLIFTIRGAPVLHTSAATAHSNPSTIITQKTASPTIPLIVANRGLMRIPVLELRGVKNYTFYNVPVGRSIFHVERGAYTAQFEACGTKIVKKFIVKGDHSHLYTTKCITAKVILKNDTGNKLNIGMEGPASYRFVLDPGKTTFTVLEGTYLYSSSGLCGTKTGTIKIRAPRVRWTWVCR